MSKDHIDEAERIMGLDKPSFGCGTIIAMAWITLIVAMICATAIWIFA